MYKIYLSGNYSETAKKNGCMTAAAIVKEPRRSAVIFLYRPHWHAYQSQAKYAGRAKIEVMRIKLPTVAVWNGPALIHITLMRIQCGRMQHALLRIIMHIA